MSVPRYTSPKTRRLPSNHSGLAALMKHCLCGSSTCHGGDARTRVRHGEIHTIAFLPVGGLAAAHAIMACVKSPPGPMHPRIIL